MPFAIHRGSLGLMGNIAAVLLVMAGAALAVHGALAFGGLIFLGGLGCASKGESVRDQEVALALVIWAVVGMVAATVIVAAWRAVT